MKYLITLLALFALALPAPAQFNGGDSDTIGSLPVAHFDPTGGIELVRMRFAEDVRNGGNRQAALARLRFELLYHTPPPKTVADFDYVRAVIGAHLGMCNMLEWPACAGDDIPIPCKGPAEWGYCDALKLCREYFDEHTWPGMLDADYMVQIKKLMECERNAKNAAEDAMIACACQGSRVPELPLPFGGFPL